MCDDREHQQRESMIGPADAVTIREMALDQINAAIPRRVYPSADTRKVVVIFLGMALLGFAALGAQTYSLVRDKDLSQALQRDGRETIATVTQVLSGHTTRVYYTFGIGGGSTFRGKAKIPEGLYWHSGNGGRLPVLFLPRDPSINHPIGWAWWTWWDLTPYAFTLFFSGVSSAILVLAYRRRSLARLGWVTEGKVIACAPQRTKFRVDYQFSTEDGQLFDGAHEYSPDEYLYGAKVRIVYVRHNPKRNDMYPLVEFAPVE
jgi:hypothetical protein